MNGWHGRKIDMFNLSFEDTPTVIDLMLGCMCIGNSFLNSTTSGWYNLGLEMVMVVLELILLGTETINLALQASVVWIRLKISNLSSLSVDETCQLGRFGRLECSKALKYMYRTMFNVCLKLPSADPELEFAIFLFEVMDRTL